MFVSELRNLKKLLSMKNRNESSIKNIKRSIPRLLPIEKENQYTYKNHLSTKRNT